MKLINAAMASSSLSSIFVSRQFFNVIDAVTAGTGGDRDRQSNERDATLCRDRRTDVETDARKGEDLLIVADDKGEEHFWHYGDGLWSLLPDPGMARAADRDNAAGCGGCASSRSPSSWLRRANTSNAVPTSGARSRSSGTTHGKVPTRSGMIDPVTLEDRADEERALRDMADRDRLRSESELPADGGVAWRLFCRACRGQAKSITLLQGHARHLADRPAAEGAEAGAGAVGCQRHREKHTAADAVGADVGQADRDAAVGNQQDARAGGVQTARAVGARRGVQRQRMALQRQSQGDHRQRSRSAST